MFRPANDPITSFAQGARLAFWPRTAHFGSFTGGNMVQASHCSSAPWSRWVRSHALSSCLGVGREDDIWAVYDYMAHVVHEWLHLCQSLQECKAS